jgi:hypothetical protein
MNADRLTYPALQREVTTRLLRHTFLSGQGAPLIFLWVLGAGLFLGSTYMIELSPLYALLWTGLILLFGGLTVRDQLKNRTLQHRLLREIAQQRVPARDLVDAPLRAAVERGAAVFAEIAVKAWDVLKARGEDPALSQVIADADGLVWLQFESVRQVEEFQRLLAFTASPAASHVASAPQPQPPGAASTQLVPRDAARLRREAIEAIDKEAGDARALVGQIGQQLETLLLQVHQMERRASDLVGTAHLTHQTGETLERLHAIVAARRKAADEVVQSLLPGRV